MTLATRQPTGRPPWPVVLLEGEEKAGKTYAALALSASDRVGRTFAFDLAEGSVDEYASLGRFEVVEHDGTYHDLTVQLDAARREPADPERPNVIVIDTISALWSMLVEEATDRARRSRHGRRLLQADPDADVPVSMNLWADAKRRWRRVIDPLLTWPGIVVLTARGRAVAEVDSSGTPTGSTSWKVEAEKSLPYDVTCWVRMTRPRTAHLIGVRSLAVQVPDGRPLPLDPFTLDGLVFDQLGLATDRIGPRDYRRLQPDAVPAAEAKRQLVAAAEQAGCPDPIDTAKGLWDAANLADAPVPPAQLDQLLTDITAAGKRAA